MIVCVRQWNPVAASKSKNQEIQKLLNRGLRYTEIQKVVDCSPRTISKVKKLMGKVG
jgi:DNA-binding CsgD family transcriptional regulator